MTTQCYHRNARGTCKEIARFTVTVVRNLPLYTSVYEACGAHALRLLDEVKHIRVHEGESVTISDRQ